MSNSIRFKFSKGKEVRFLSHLDLLRALQRALRRGRLPIAFSGGFSPKPKMSFGPALSVGIYSLAEYGDFEFRKKMDPKEFIARYNSCLPSGLKVLKAVNLLPGSPALMRVINTAQYELVLPGKNPAEIRKRINWLLAQDTFMVNRETKKGIRKLNILPLLLEKPKVRCYEGGVIISCRSAAGQTGNLRLAELGSMLDFDHLAAKVTRTALLIKEGEKYRVPIEN